MTSEITKKMGCYRSFETGKYLSLEMALFCQNTLHEDQYTLLHTLSKQFFYIKWGNSKLCVSNASNASLGIEKRWSLNYIFDVTETKRSHWVSNQDCTADDPSIQNILFELMCVSSHWRGGKRSVFGGWFSAISSSTNGDVPCRIDSTTFR